MPIYKGSQKQKEVYIGNVKIGKIYKGNILVYTSLKYPIDTILFESSTPGTSSIELEKGIYEIYCIAGGGGGWGKKGGIIEEAAGGGSGSGFIGQITISKGNYKVTVGAGGAGGSVSGENGGNSTIGNIVKTLGGSGSGKYAPGGAAPEITTSIVSTILNQSGNTGKYNGQGSNPSADGGASLYNGYGAGGTGRSIGGGESGSSGYVKIVYKGN